MLRQASKRNTAAIRAARVTLMRALVDQIAPALDGPSDAILAVNCLGFWPAPAERLAELRRRLAPGGRVAIASRPRLPPGPRRTRPAAPPEKSRTC
jgi:SAM-dependent methyltransferase